MKNIKKFFLAVAVSTLFSSNFLISMDLDLDEKTPLINGTTSSYEVIAPITISISDLNNLYETLKLEKTLKLSQYKFKNIKELENIFLSLKRFWAKIENIDLSYCDISELPGCMTSENFPHLETLNLTCNTVSLQALEKIAQLTPLKNLVLGACNIKQLPKNIMQLKKLTYLDLTNNPLSPEALGYVTQISSLEKLCLLKCGIKKFPDTCKLPELKSIDLIFNGINENGLDKNEQTRIRLLFFSYKRAVKIDF
jgi:Leucine-rich repeat (LRR) protein